MKRHLSIDIGGTKVRCVIYSSSYKIIKEFSLPTQEYFHEQGVSDLESLLTIIKANLHDNYFDRLGVSINCAIKDNKIIYSSLLAGAGGLNLHEVVKKYFRFNTFLSDNDVRCMARAEKEFGIGRKYSNFLLINLGTGIRLVSVDNKTVYNGSNNLAGEISLSKIWVEEISDYISADFVTSGKGIANLSKIIFNKDQTAKEAFQNKDTEVIELFIKYLTKLILDATFMYNPEAIIFTGSLIKSKNMWLPKLKRNYLSFRTSFLIAKKITTSGLAHPASLGAILD